MEKIEGTTRNSMAYDLDTRDMGILILGYKREISRLKMRIEKIDMNPKNEGQATYLMKKSNLIEEVKQLQDYIAILEMDRDLLRAASTRDPEKLQEAIKKHQETN
jgi:hypothetical protein